jgi:hypothetical protein
MPEIETTHHPESPMLRTTFARSLLLVVAGTLALAAVSRSDEKAEPRQAHMVFFTLKDHSREARDKLVDSCKKHLTGHEGAVSFSVGVIADDVKEPVSDRDFDVALHLVFCNKAAGARYLAHPRHRQFVEENKDTWAKVRVFDSYLAAE